MAEQAGSSITQKQMSKGVMKAYTRLNVFVYRLSGGRLMGRMDGAPVCLVTMTGRKSGRKRTIPLICNEIGEDVVLVASQGGAPVHPVWYHNLVADPDVEIKVRGKPRRRMRVRQANAEEKASLWPALVANFPSFDIYRQRTERDIPVMVCSPVG